MKWIIKSKNEIVTEVVEEIIDLVRNKPNCVLGLATGTTMIDIYKLLGTKGKFLDWSKVKTFNLDEYVGLTATDPLSFQYYMNKYLFRNINILPNNVFFPLQDNFENYDDLIAKSGGIDLQLLGVGINGHIAFNEPGSLSTSKTRIIDLEISTIKRNQSLQNTNNPIPKKAYTMGIATILQGKRILCISFGKKKLYALRQLKRGHIDNNIPITHLISHNNTVIYFDLPV